MRRLVNNSNTRQQPLEILQQKISIFEKTQHAQVHANAGNEPPALPMRTLRFGNPATKPEIHAGCRKEQRSKWRVPSAVKNVTRYNQQIFSQLPAVKTPIERDDNRKEDNKRERVEEHCERRLKRTLLGIVSPNARRRFATIRPAVVYPRCRRQRNRATSNYFAFLASDSVRAFHITVAESAMLPSHGRRSRNVITMFALSWSFIDTAIHMTRRSAFDTRPHPTDILPQSMKRFFH